MKHGKKAGEIRFELEDDRLVTYIDGEKQEDHVPWRAEQVLNRLKTQLR